jgi:glycerophosphoryl diester phosphodiesterase
MRRLLQAGIDGMITDRPDIARQVLARAAYALPPAQ